RALSAISDARIVWGGDAKIAAYEALPLRPGGKALWFGDRRSFCILKAEALRQLDGTQLEQLADRMARDILPFDQLACSSPQSVVVVGDTHETATALIDRVAALAVERGGIPALGHQMRKFTLANLRAAEGSATPLRYGIAAPLTVLDAECPSEAP